MKCSAESQALAQCNQIMRDWLLTNVKGTSRFLYLKNIIDVQMLHAFTDPQICQTREAVQHIHKRIKDTIQENGTFFSEYMNYLSTNSKHSELTICLNVELSLGKYTSWCLPVV